MSEISKEETRTLKQNYLVENVIQKGFDADDFSKFMANAKTNGTDIENWTYEELIDMVQDFTARDQFESYDYYEDEQLQFDSMTQSPGENDTNNQQSNSQTENKISEMKKTTEIGSNKSTKINILKEEKHKISFFYSTQAYTIETLPFGYNVIRTSEEFLWLRKKLMETYPGVYVAHCESYRNNKAIFQRFQNSILGRRELRNLQVFQDFLTLEKLDVKYEAIDLKNLKPKEIDLFEVEGNNINNFTMKEYKKIVEDNLVQGVESNEVDFTTFSGILTQLADNDTKQLRKIKYASVDLKNAFSTASKALLNMSSLLNKLLESKDKFMSQTKLNTDHDREQIIKALKKGLEGWGTNQLTMNSFINDHLTSFFHFNKHELFAVKELGKMRDQCMNSFKLSSNDLEEKKLKLFEERAIENWGSNVDNFEVPVSQVLTNYNVASKYILPKETDELKQKTQVVQFACFQQIGEYLLFRKRSNRRFIENFAKLGEKVKNNIMNDKDALWNSFGIFKNSTAGSEILKANSL